MPLVLTMKKTLARWLDSDVGYSFRTSPMAMVAALIALVCVFCSIFAGWVAPHNPFDLATLELSDARLPPAWSEHGTTKYLLGTDDQGRDILSALIYGARISLVVGLARITELQRGQIERVVRCHPARKQRAEHAHHGNRRRQHGHGRCAKAVANIAVKPARKGFFHRRKQ